MYEDCYTLWEAIFEKLKSELTSTSYTTWLVHLKPVALLDNILVLSTVNVFTKNIINGRYLNVIYDAAKSITNKNIEIKIVSEDEEEYKKIKETVQYKNDKDKIVSNMLNPKYTFDTFVVGNSNKLAHAACLAVAQSPARAYNPLFIYGGVGLGKTHLMHAIGHFVLEHNSNTKIMYVTSETFTNELVNSIKDDKNEEFRNKYRSMDILLIDDIQFIAKKERTQEEFFHTFNTLYEANKQIIVSSDRPPKEIPTLEDRLRSRFEWGLIADIQPPDFETRIAILKKKAQNENLNIPDDVLIYIAEKIPSNIRELEGALIRIVAFSSLTKANIDLDLAKDALKDIISNKVRKITVKLIQEEVCKYYNIKYEDFISKKRTKTIAFPRQIAMYLAREMTDLSLPKIGEEFGKDHTTVIHAYDKISNDIKEDESLNKQIEELKKRIKGF
ncbi:chromosomal replication initiation protein DnaA [Thermoanaerobacterium thermosaccharolyticum]|uniref:Chromosomal replication initiator protein DnaA n=1 Tax=Thermoanaerobacterium thermosaccharolyticum TaxID=1517 RepID=A0A231VES4_THETR|nr:chromosomal replication initiator protein DnaA [Thermoanaerobacterium thermosaccharolyticum]OXT06648.1 chromosomal replication initiation protein DnaA [Thermoanaerobacterium thermosaccharolyticum]